MRPSRSLRRPAVLLAAALAGAAAVPAIASTGSPAASAARHWAPRPATYDVVKQTNIPIRMSDGVTLMADVLRPGHGKAASAGRFPVVLTQTPYNKNIPGTNFEDDYLVERGYIQLIVDVRGTGSSGGTWDSFGPREQKDYYETAVFAHRLAGGNGAVALQGTSYGAIDQLLTAAQHPPGLKAAFPVVPMGDAYRDVAASGGQVDTGFIPFWLGLVTATGAVPGTTASPATLTTLLQHLLGITKFQLPAVLSATTQQAVAGEDAGFDGPFYRVRSPLQVVNRITVPTFVVGGEYDLFQRGEPMIYNALRAQRVPTRLLIGPWTHLAASEGTGLPADGVPSLDELRLRWFDHYVRGIADPALDREVPPVTAYRIGTGHYETGTSYPLAGTSYVPLRLGGTASVGKAGTLGSARPASGTGTVPYVPVAGVCSVSTSQWTAGIVPLTAPCANDARLNDATGIAYDLPVRGTRALRFDGPSTARLFVSTTRADAQVTARLEDVAPDGTVTGITAGWQVLSLRALDARKSVWAGRTLVQPWHPDTRASVLPVVAGKVYELDVEIFPTAAAVLPGHTLRLALQTADEPHLTAPLPQAVNAAGGVLTVYADPAHPSALDLGVER